MVACSPALACASIASEISASSTPIPSIDQSTRLNDQDQTSASKAEHSMACEQRAKAPSSSLYSQHVPISAVTCAIKGSSASSSAASDPLEPEAAMAANLAFTYSAASKSYWCAIGLSVMCSLI